MNPRNIDRRSWMRQAALAGIGYFAAPTMLRAHNGHQPSPTGGTPALTAFKDPLPRPVELAPQILGKTARYSVSMRQGLAQFHSELPPTVIWGYNGIFSVPLIRARKGRPVLVRQYNDLRPHGGKLVHGHDALPAVHLHGARVLPEHDGHPEDAIPWGGFRDYHYPNEQPGATLLFHDHAHEATGYHVWMGLAGFYLIEEDVPTGIPAGEFDIPLLLQDRTVAADGSLSYALTEQVRENGMQGDCVLVNGRIQPHLKVAQRTYRFRVANASNSRIYELRLQDGRPLVQIGSDGGLLRSPHLRESIALAPFERAEILVDFSGAPLGSSLLLKNTQGEGRTADVLRFDVQWSLGNGVASPPPVDCLSEWTEIIPAAADPRREFVLDRHSTPAGAVWTIDGKTYAHGATPLAAPKLGSVEVWKFVNPTNHPHPMHLHLVQFQVIELNGVPQDPAWHGWKDTVLVPPRGSASIAVRFDGYAGRYLFHCHNLEHEDLGMMAEFEVRA